MRGQITHLVLTLAFVASTMFFTGCSQRIGEEAEDCDGNNDVSAPIDWSASEILIGTEAELQKFAVLVNSGRNFFAQTIILAQNIYIVSNNWTPIGDLSINPFRGTFNGNNNTIDGVGLSLVGNFSGLFGHLQGGIIKNTNVIVDMEIDENSTLAVAGIVVVNAGVVKNSSVAGSIEISSTRANFIGGAVSAINNGVIENSFVEASITAGNNFAAFVGDNLGEIKNSFALRGSDEDVFVLYNFGEICENSGWKSETERQR